MKLNLSHRRGLLSVMVMVLLLFLSISAAQAKDDQTVVPKEIGGFVLGTSVADYPILVSNYLKEVVVTDWHGFRKGIIYYGTCDKPGNIVKMRMKYEDGSKKYYKKLLKAYKKKFGEPQIWKGDSFGILQVWRWKFTDENGQLVNLTLQHNERDPRETLGNMVKMALPMQEERERLCFIENCDLPQNEEERIEKEKQSEPDWDMLIPR